MRDNSIKDRILRGLVWLSAFVTMGMLVWILTYVLMKGMGSLSWAFLTEMARGDGEGGILPMIVTTFYVIAISIAMATPIGICAAIYLVEYAKPGKLVRTIRFATESLAGIPSIIFGLFGFLFFVTVLHFKFSILSGALTLSIMVLPTIVRTTEEALKAVPQSYREGSLGLGASKLSTIMNVVLPSAVPGILAAVILSVGRIIGETAAIYMTVGMAPYIPKGFMESGRTLSVHLYLLAKEGISFEKAYATAAVLIIIVAFLNFIANKTASALNRNR
ncbi:MAG: phosphate ABC transporter, permease protein PstA [Clostridiales bacterium]|mgnify:CR=1 FL=1|nr:MAG: phosphate ABC transporter, permease protein PstA [Clostridiales bacterium]